MKEIVRFLALDWRLVPTFVKALLMIGLWYGVNVASRDQGIARTVGDIRDRLSDVTAVFEAQPTPFTSWNEPFRPGEPLP
jgi:hypothetical protein